MRLIFGLSVIMIAMAVEVGFGCGGGWVWWLVIFVIGLWCL